MTPITATLIVSRSYSKCGYCGNEAHPDSPTHDTVTGYTLRPRAGCGAKFTAITTDNARLDEQWRATLASMRPDLPIVEYGEEGIKPPAPTTEPVPHASGESDRP